RSQHRSFIGSGRSQQEARPAAVAAFGSPGARVRSTEAENAVTALLTAKAWPRSAPPRPPGRAGRRRPGRPLQDEPTGLQPRRPVRHFLDAAPCPHPLGRALHQQAQPLERLTRGFERLELEARLPPLERWLDQRAPALDL